MSKTSLEHMLEHMARERETLFESSHHTPTKQKHRVGTGELVLLAVDLADDPGLFPSTYTVAL